KLEDGTKVTIETTPWANNPNMTLSSKVTITNGDYGVQVSGIDTNKTGDLRIDEAAGWGKTLDWAVADGNKIRENPNGSGFVAVDSHGRVRQVDQQYINETDLMKGGAQQLQERYKDAFRFLSSLLSISFVGSFLSHLAGNDGPSRAHHHHHGHPHTLDEAVRDSLKLTLTLVRAI
ncbi:MAG TPA: DUF1521 domain-containing protein, partial [Ideonella sp.]|nr:DUF1521 domain-containing protein [Ideonella sp.]